MDRRAELKVRRCGARSRPWSLLGGDRTRGRGDARGRVGRIGARNRRSRHRVRPRWAVSWSCSSGRAVGRRSVRCRGRMGADQEPMAIRALVVPLSHLGASWLLSPLWDSSVLPHDRADPPAGLGYPRVPDQRLVTAVGRHRRGGVDDLQLRRTGTTDRGEKHRAAPNCRSSRAGRASRRSRVRRRRSGTARKL